MRVAPGLLAALTLAAGLSACGGISDTTPAACLDGPAQYLNALQRYPGKVELRGGVPLSACLAENQQAGDLASVGEAMVVVATRLNAQARGEPGGKANLELGYLLGAAQRGADRSEGIHAELLRRLSVAARYSRDNRPLPPKFIETYEAGFNLGEASG
jgi:hypothetical protein